jgi:hypothetical protein
MISVERVKVNDKTVVSCVLTPSSLADMSQLSPPFCIGWIVAAVGKWITRSRLPNSVRKETNAVMKSIQLILSSFDAQDLAALLDLPCWSSRCDFLFERLALETNITAMDSADMGLGFGCFDYFDGNESSPSLIDVRRHIEESNAVTSHLLEVQQ